MSNAPEICSHLSTQVLYAHIMIARKTPVYLDGFATQPLAPEVRDAMLAAWSEPGNAGSPHCAGERAARYIADARASIADLIGAAPSEIVFTSGATEANNLAIVGAVRSAMAREKTRRRIVVSSIEHKSVLEAAAALTAEGLDVLRAPVDDYGRLDIERLCELVTDNCLLVSVMLANNETGVIQPVAEAADIAHAAGALFHSDAAQAFGKIPIDVVALDADYVSFSAHKCYGPMGVGALFVSATAPKPAPMLHGGGQQGALRPGTEPFPLIAGFGEAAHLCHERLSTETERLKSLAERLQAELGERQTRFRKISGPHDVLPGSLALALEGASADSLCAMLAREVQLSTGSACNSGQIRTSHVLESMGYSQTEANEVIRVYCSRYTTHEDIARAAEAISAAVSKSRVATGRLRQ